MQRTKPIAESNNFIILVDIAKARGFSYHKTRLQL